MKRFSTIQTLAVAIAVLSGIACLYPQLRKEGPCEQTNDYLAWRL